MKIYVVDIFGKSVQATEEFIQKTGINPELGDFGEYMRYLYANFFKEWFKNQIIRLDVDNQFYRKSEATGISPATVEAAKNLYALNFADKINELDILKEAWKNSHLQLYRNQPSLPSSSNSFNDMLMNMSDIEISGIIQRIDLAAAVNGYKAANQLLKSIDNSKLDPFCTENHVMLNPEHTSLWKAAVLDMHDSLDLLPVENWIESLNLRETTYNKFRISLNRVKTEDFDLLANLAQLASK